MRRILIGTFTGLAAHAGCAGRALATAISGSPENGSARPRAVNFVNFQQVTRCWTGLAPRVRPVDCHRQIRRGIAVSAGC